MFVFFWVVYITCWYIRVNIVCHFKITIYYSMMYFQHVSVDIWRLANSIVSMLQVGYFEGKSTIPLMREGHDSSGTCLLQVNQLFFKNSKDGANTTHMSALVCVSVY